MSNTINAVVILEPKSLPKHVVKDGVKWGLIPAKIILDGLSLWPERQDTITRYLTALCFASFIFVTFGQIHYLYQGAPNPASAGFTVIISIAVIEAMARQILLIYHRKRLVKLLNVVYSEFWPSSVVEEKLQVKLKKGSWYIALYCCVYTCSGFICVVQLFTAPLLTGNRNLPSHSTYPFNWRKSPIYEILYVWNTFTGQAVTFIIGGTDLFFVTLLWNCITQFIILQNRFRTNFENSILKGSDGLQVLFKCISHHNKLTQTCREMEEIFTYFILLQFLANIGTVCISCFVATVMPQEIGMCGTYLVAHLGQLFIYCYLGTQLIYESTALSDSVFQCGWHLSDKIAKLRQPLVILMLRCQKQQRLTAGGFAVVDLTSFVKVVKLSFSVYTLLNSLMENRN